MYLYQVFTAKTDKPESLAENVFERVIFHNIHNAIQYFIEEEALRLGDTRNPYLTIKDALDESYSYQIEGMGGSRRKVRLALTHCPLIKIDYGMSV